MPKMHTPGPLCRICNLTLFSKNLVIYILNNTHFSFADKQVPRKGDGAGSGTGTLLQGSNRGNKNGREEKNSSKVLLLDSFVFILHNMQSK
jgi:hypothetical protein